MIDCRNCIFLFCAILAEIGFYFKDIHLLIYFNTIGILLIVGFFCFLDFQDFRKLYIDLNLINDQEVLFD